MLAGLFRFCFTMPIGLDGEIGRHSGLKIRRLPDSGVPVRFRLEAPVNVGMRTGTPGAQNDEARKRAGFDSGSRHQ
jgi:hypothetical protein